MEKKINSREIKKVKTNKNLVSDIQGKGERSQEFQDSTLGG